MTVNTMLKHNPLKQVTGLLRTQDWPEIPDSEPNPYTVVRQGFNKPWRDLQTAFDQANSERT
jgi:hypothetical protein